MAYNEIQFKGFKLINANGNSVATVLNNAKEKGVLYLVRTNTDDADYKDGYLILDGKVYGSAEEAKASIAGLNANISIGSNKFVKGKIVETNGKITEFSIDESALKTKIGQIDNAIKAITNDNGTIDTKINALDATVSGTSTNSGITVTIEQVDGKLSGVTVTEALGTASKADVNKAVLSIPENNENNSGKTGLTTAAQVENFVKASVADLTGAMHFVGAVTGGTENYTGPKKSGDVIIVTDTKKEYVYDGSKWVELGDEGLYVTKNTTIAGLSLQNSISKTKLLEALSVADGAQVNVLEGVKVNGNTLTPDTEKKVNITVATGEANGTIKVNGADVAVKGLGSAAYVDTTAFDAADTAANKIAEISGTTSGTSTNSYVTVATTQDHGKVTGITVNDSALKEAITGITNNISTLNNEAVKNVNGKTGNTITLTGADIAVGVDVDGDGTMTTNNKVSEVLVDIYTKLNTTNANAYTGITAADGDHTVIVTPTTHGHSVAVNLKALSDTEKASGLIQLVSDENGSGIYGKLFYDGEEVQLNEQHSER